MTGHDRLSLLGRRIPSAFEVWQVRLAPGAERSSDASEWTDALVVVERGSVEVECVGGGRRAFASGDSLCLAWLPLRVIRNIGDEEALLVAVRRRSTFGGRMSLSRRPGHGGPSQ